MPTVLTHTFSNPATAASCQDLLIIEQEDWYPYTGTVTKANVVRWLANRLYGGDDVSVDCGISSDGNMVCGLFVYTLDPGLAFQLHASYGTLSEPSIKEVEFTEIVNFNMEAATLDRPVRNLVRQEWLSAFDQDGNRIAGPGVTADGLTLTPDQPVYGSLKLTYTALQHAYMLTVAPREEATANRYSTVVYAPYDGGFSYLVVDPAPGADEFDIDEGCGYSSSSGLGSVEWPELDPAEMGADRHKTIEYCSQQIISDVTYDNY